MTKKDYELIAKALKLTKPTPVAWKKDHSTAYQGWRDAVAGVTGALASDNPRFRRDLFLCACGVE